VGFRNSADLQVFAKTSHTAIDFPIFSDSEALKRAFVRSVEVVGEAVKRLPDKFRSEHADIPWRMIAGTRDKLIHDYFGVDYEFAWDIVRN
jgi:uncharacterized protein with HEPN domain